MDILVVDNYILVDKNIGNRMERNIDYPINSVIADLFYGGYHRFISKEDAVLAFLYAVGEKGTTIKEMRYYFDTTHKTLWRAINKHVISGNARKVMEKKKRREHRYYITKGGRDHFEEYIFYKIRNILETYKRLLDRGIPPHQLHRKRIIFMDFDELIKAVKDLKKIKSG